MKRIIILAMVLIMLLISIGGCWQWRDEGDRDEGHDRNEYPRGHTGPGGAGGGH